MRFSGWTELLLNAEMDADVFRLEPASSSSFKMGRFIHSGHSEDGFIELGGLRLLALRHRKLHVMEVVDLHNSVVARSELLRLCDT